MLICEPDVSSYLSAKKHCSTHPTGAVEDQQSRLLGCPGSLEVRQIVPKRSIRRFPSIQKEPDPVINFSGCNRGALEARLIAPRSVHC